MSGDLFHRWAADDDAEPEGVVTGVRPVESPRVDAQEDVAIEIPACTLSHAV